MSTTGANCKECVKPVPIGQTSECQKTKAKITAVRFFCEEDLSVVLGQQTPPDGCANNVVTDLVLTDPVAEPTPLYCALVENKEDLDELYEMTTDEATNIPDRNYSLPPLIKVYTPDQECYLQSMENKEVGMLYKCEGLSSDNPYQWRLFFGTLNTVSGGLKGGYTTTFESKDPSSDRRPKWVDFGDIQTTDDAIDLITVFA